MQELQKSLQSSSLDFVRILVIAVNTRKTKYMEVGCHRRIMESEHITVDSNAYEKVKNLKYLSGLLTNQNSI